RGTASQWSGRALVPHPWGHAARGPQGIFLPESADRATGRRFPCPGTRLRPSPRASDSLAGTPKGAPMGIVNRRNAVLGWAVWNFGKRFAKKKAKGAVPSVDTETKRPNASATILAALAAAGGALMFWRKRG